MASVNGSEKSVEGDSNFKERNTDGLVIYNSDSEDDNHVDVRDNAGNIKISSPNQNQNFGQEIPGFVSKREYNDDSESDVSFTSFRENTSINVFKRGILCSSTPVPPAKKLKIELDHLSVIEEVDNSNDENSGNVTVLENEVKDNSRNVPVIENEVKGENITVFENDTDESNGNVTVVENTCIDQNSGSATVIENKFYNKNSGNIAEIKSFDAREKCDDSKSSSPAKDRETDNSPLIQTKENSGSVDNGNETVLHMDELSMIVEMPDNRMVTVIENPLRSEKAGTEKNNLTVNVDNDLSVTYKNIEEKTIDEVILTEGNLAQKVEDLITLDHEPDRERIIQKANNLQVFVSNDDAENKDNNDPEWELLRKLETDDERYKAVRRIWKNLTIPDPKMNLSAYNWRNKNSLGPLKNIQLPKSLPENKALLNNNYHCTEVLDVAVQNLWEFYQGRRQGIEVDHNYEYSILASLRKQPKTVREAINNNRNSYQLSLDQLHSCFQERLHRHQKAKEEIEAIHKFYNGLRNREENSSNLLILNHRERQEVLDVENMITSYSNWYKK